MLQVRKQLLYILQVLPSGVFVKVQHIGPHCSDDDELVLEMQQERERRWRSNNPQVHLRCAFKYKSVLCCAGLRGAVLCYAVAC